MTYAKHTFHLYFYNPFHFYFPSISFLFLFREITTPPSPMQQKTKPKPPSLMSRMTHPHKVYPPRAARGDFRWGRFSDVLPQESWSVRLIRIVFEMYEGASWEFLHWSKRKKPNNTTSPSSSASSSRRRQRVCVHSPSTSCCFISNYGSGFVVVCGEFHGGFVVVRVCSR